MNKKIENFIILLLIFIQFASCKKNTQNFELTGVFGFVWFESTAHNLYIVQNQKSYPIKFSKKSNQKYLKALWALKYEILCFNSDGRQIMLEGTYSSENEEFVLNSWYFEGIFFRVEEFKVDGEQKYILKGSLTEDDFESQIEIPYEDLVKSNHKFFNKDLRPENKSRSYLKIGDLNIWSYEKIKYKNGKLFRKFYEINLNKYDCIVFENGVEVKVSGKSEVYIGGKLLKKDIQYVLIDKSGELKFNVVVYP